MSASTKMTEAEAFVRVVDAVRDYMESQRDEIVSHVGMHPEGDEEGAKYWARGLGSDVEGVVLVVFDEWEES